MENIWFDSWESILRTICLTALTYGAMLVLLRTTGKRTLSKMNAFDFIITIVLGSILASAALNKDISLADALTAIVLLVGLQFLLTSLAIRVPAIRNAITSKPTLMFYKGEFLQKAMKSERITEEEIYFAGRQKGISSLDDVDMIILEPTGDLTIIERKTDGGISTVSNVTQTAK